MCERFCERSQKQRANGKIMREIVLDTETTGLGPFTGHRVVEIGCIDLVNCISTTAPFHVYFNPERDMPAEAEAIHGLSSAFLSDKPKFADVAESLVEFLGDAKLVIHNAGFDLSFLNAELDRLKRPPIGRDRVVDSRRTKHGALLDAELLAEVYAELVGGRQARFSLDRKQTAVRALTVASAKERPAPLSPRLTSDEEKAHRTLLAALGANSVWRDYLGE